MSFDFSTRVPLGFVHLFSYLAASPPAMAGSQRKSASKPSRLSESSSSKRDRDRGVNIQVVIRCRPLSDDEVKASTPVVISCNESAREVLAIQSIAGKQIDRNYVFDRVFGPASKQIDLFVQAVFPIVNEVLEGYNCTIFAYGQTGTGKTYTMEGGTKDKSGEFSGESGVIPRAVKQIFDKLEAHNAIYTMKVSFLELYNEEITDLLAPDEAKSSEEKPRRPVSLMEDGKGGVFARGLEEEVVCSASEIYSILDKGSSKRRTAETLLNKQSSRSHSIFTITIQLKEATATGDKMMKSGKLNLVDLAGSENILRSGAREGRAREAGEINKSLLTLGRVINALVERSGHVPYRDSKLTRLLRDSLGGKTKTCIIATISPSIYCLEETLSTLDYAHRAKNIKNKPEINQKMMKSERINDLCFEINRLKQEIYATRGKDGICIPSDRYQHEETERKAMAEKMERLEFQLESKDEQLVGLREFCDSQKYLSTELSEELEKLQRKLESAEGALFELDQRYRHASSAIEEKEYLISCLLKSERALSEHTCELQAELENAAANLSSLFSRIESKDDIEDGNRIIVQKFHAQLIQQLNLLHKVVSVSVMQQKNQLEGIEEEMQSFASSKAEATKVLHASVEKLKDMYGYGIRMLDDLTRELDDKSQSAFTKLKSEVLMQSCGLDKYFKDVMVEADQLLNELQSCLSKQESKLAIFSLQHHEGYLRTLEATRSISKITTEFFCILDAHVIKLSMILDESKTLQNQQLCDLEKMFEERAANEERKLLEKVTEMLANSTIKNKEMVQEAVESLRETVTDRTHYIQKEISTACDYTASVKVQLMDFAEEVEARYIQDTVVEEIGTCSLVEGLQQCKMNARISSEQWGHAQEPLFTFGNEINASADSIIRSGLEANQLVRAKLSRSASAALEDVDFASKDLLSSINSSFKLDHGACDNIDDSIITCHEELRALQSAHHQKILQIIDNAGSCFEGEYVVDKPSCSTPKKRLLNVASMASIEETRARPSIQVNGEVTHFFEACESQPLAFTDAKFPVTISNET